MIEAALVSGIALQKGVFWLLLFRQDKLVPFTMHSNEYNGDAEIR